MSLLRSENFLPTPHCSNSPFTPLTPHLTCIFQDTLLTTILTVRRVASSLSELPKEQARVFGLRSHLQAAEWSATAPASSKCFAVLDIVNTCRASTSPVNLPAIAIKLPATDKQRLRTKPLTTSSPTGVSSATATTTTTPTLLRVHLCDRSRFSWC
jgi:hypothetical protein